MNIYNFVFCYFYFLWEKRKVDGRFEGISHVILTLLLHIFLLFAIFEYINDINIFKYFFGEIKNSAGFSKIFVLLAAIPLYFILSKYYNKNKIKLLLSCYKNSKINKYYSLLMILLIVLLPLIVIIYLSYLNNSN